MKHLPLKIRQKTIYNVRVSVRGRYPFLIVYPGRECRPDGSSGACAKGYPFAGIQDEKRKVSVR